MSSPSDDMSPRGTRQLERQVRGTLLELMLHSESDAVRVSAARALMDKIRQTNEADEAERHNADEHADAIAEACALLAEFAEAKSGGVRGPPALDQDGAAGAADAAL